ncbi:MAG: Fic family protein [Acetobacteraceae bacterium]
MAHVQFETIHPFLDGNGRLGRPLITLILCEAGVLWEPILYLSRFLKSRRDDYYRLLQEVRQAGTWETWMEFFLTGVAETAEQAVATARDLIAMFDAHRQKIARIGRASASALRVHELTQASPIVTIQTASEKLAVSFSTASTALENLAKIGVVGETTGRQRGRIYGYSDYLALLDRGTDPLPA